MEFTLNEREREVVRRLIERVSALGYDLTPEQDALLVRVQADEIPRLMDYDEARFDAGMIS